MEKREYLGIVDVWNDEATQANGDGIARTFSMLPSRM